ncbi:MAG: helix-turn-helix domain-containing protein [Dehalococcoidia bacterium]|nr:helix-turn-helix domain-containing protein [Dehalococcoidia bacterium]
MPMMPEERHEPSQLDLFPETTQRILLELKRRGSATVPELAETLQLSNTAVRQPLKTLAGAGLVDYGNVGSGPGRRRHAYSLTPAAEQIFPRPYYQLAQNLLEFLRQRSPELLAEFLRVYGRAYADDLYRRAGERPAWEALQRAAGWYEDLGYLTHTEEDAGGELSLTMYHCPYLDLARADARLCEREMAVLERVFDEHEVERTDYKVTGDLHCRYAFRPRDRQEARDTA